MRTRIISIVIAAVLCNILGMATTRPNIAKTEGMRIFKTLLCNPSNFPVSFTYNGVDHKGFGGLKVISRDVVDTDAGRQATMRFALDDAMQIMGGIGYTDDCRISRLWRDQRVYRIMAGTEEIMVHTAGRAIVKEAQGR